MKWQVVFKLSNGKTVTKVYANMNTATQAMANIGDDVIGTSLSPAM